MTSEKIPKSLHGSSSPTWSRVTSATLALNACLICSCMLARGESGERGSLAGSSSLLLHLCCQLALLVLFISSVAHLFFASVAFIAISVLLSFSLIPSYLLHLLSCSFLSSFLCFLLHSFFFLPSSTVS